MTDFDDESGVYTSRAARRKPAVIGVIGLAAILGGGAYFATEAMTGPVAVAPEAAPAPITTPASDLPPATEESALGAAARGESPTPSTTSSAAGAAEPAAAGATTSRDDSVAAAVGTAAKARQEAPRPLPPVAAAAVVKDVRVRNTGSLAVDGATLRVISGRGDLTGQRELALVADDGIAVGDARCGQRFHFTAGAPAVEKPTMMICWRTSAERSVITVAVSRTGRPSAAAGVAAITKQWSELR